MAESGQRYSQPRYCAVVRGQCPHPVERVQDAIALAYPFQTWTKDWAERVAATAATQGLAVYSPHKSFASTYVVCGICREIRARPYHISEVTDLNWNVFFEAGLAFGFDKVTILAEDANADVSVSRAVFPEHIRASYHHTDELISQVAQAIGVKGLSLRDFPARVDPRRIYFVDPGILNDHVREMRKALRRLRGYKYSAPEGGMAMTPTMHSELTELHGAGVVVGFLLPRNYKDQLVINARCCFLLGVATALEKPVLLFAQEPHPAGPSDLKLLLQPFSSQQTMCKILEEWISAIGDSATPTEERARPDIRDLDLGNAAAERDPELDRYFLETGHYRRATQGAVTVFLGRRGSGKSAIALTLASQYESNGGVAFAEVRPEGFEMAELQDAYLSAFTAGAPTRHWKLVLSAAWRYLLLAEIARAYIRLYEQRGWRAAELDGLATFLAIIPHEDDFLDAVLKVTAFIRSASDADLHAFMSTVSSRGVYRTFEEFTNRAPCRVIIDNLDVTWDASHEESRFVLAGLIREAERVNHRLHAKAAILLFLRTDIYNLVRLADPDVDKQSRETITWDATSLLELIGLRLKYVLKLDVEARDAWREVFPLTVRGQNTADFMVERTLRRPRELIKLVTLAVQEAQARRSGHVSESDVLAATEKYSEILLSELHGEYLIELPDLYYFLVELSGEVWPKSADALHALIKRAAQSEKRAKRHHAWHSLPPDVLVSTLYEVGVFGLQRAEDEGPNSYPDVCYSFERDWKSAYAQTRRRVTTTYGKGKVRGDWTEPHYTLHQGLVPVLGAVSGEGSGAYRAVTRTAPPSRQRSNGRRRPDPPREHK
jgi:hypothetical protein